jgi:V8-like Glu-specific endopeptidase
MTARTEPFDGYLSFSAQLRYSFPVQIQGDAAMRKAVLAVLLFSSIAVFGADRAEPLFVPHPVGEVRRAPRLALSAPGDALVTLGAADEVVPEEVEAVRAWNREGRTPMKNGFTRSIGGALAVRIGGGDGGVKSESTGGGRVAKTSAGSLVWSGSVRVERAWRFRVHLRNVNVPAGTTFWVYGADGSETAFGTELIDANRELWAPSVSGEIAHLEVEIPGGQQGTFEIADVLELVGGRPPVQVDDTPSCLVDMKCISSSTLDVIEQLGRAVAHLQYVKGSSGYVCSGGLINDTDTSGVIPYLLTANHCFDTQPSATSLEAYWDYRTATCGGAFPSLNTITRTVGSTLIATGAGTDFTLVRMNSIPGSRILLGWNANASAVPNGTRIHRVSHPFPDDYSVPAPQFYSSTNVLASSAVCSARPRPNYLYSTFVQGGTYGGSSGSPVIISGGYIVGQLFGACGPNPSAGCDAANYSVDGAFSQTYSSIASFINPGTTPAGCTANSTTACMLNNRFRVQVRYRAGFDNNPPDTNAQVKSVSGFSNPGFETGFFFFNSESNIEMLVKILDQGNTNNQGQPTIAVLYGSATPLAIELTITDTKNGASKTYRSNFGAMSGGTDFTAFVK